MKNEVKTDIALTIEAEPYIEMMQYAHEFSPKECSGVGLVERIDYTDDSVVFNVKKVYLPLQKNTSVATDISDEELNKLNTQLVEDGEDTRLLKFHWHSHVDMSVFHSGTDTDNYDEMKTGDYAISLVVNKRYEMLGSVHLYEPLRINVLDVEVLPPEDIDLSEYVLPKDLRKKIEANVKKVQDYEEVEALKEVPTTYPTYAGSRSWYDDDYYGYGNGKYSGTSYGIGLDHDKEFYTLLVQGEKAGLIRLLYDTDNVTITGYVNLSTNRCFELSSYEELTTV